MIDAAELLSGPPRLPENPIDLLRRLVSSGHVRAAEKLLTDHVDWIRSLPVADSEAIEVITVELSALQAVEHEYGKGSALDMEHPLNKRLLQLRRLIDCFTDEELENARKMTAAGAGQVSGPR